MKKVQLILLLIITSVSLNAQDFEGIIAMYLNYEGDAAEMLQSMSPNKMTMTIKGENTAIKMEGGMSAMLGKMITKGDKFYMVMDAQKTVFESDVSEDNGDEENPEETSAEDAAEVIDLNETETIAGYKCKKYEVKYNDEEAGNEITKYYVWIAKDFKAKYVSGGAGNNQKQNELFNEILGGFPFKQEITMNTQMGEIKTITEVTKVDEKAISDSEFNFPEGYQVKPMADFMKGMGGGR